jgi:hypothetical protein
MAIQSQIRRSDIYVGDGVQTQFSFSFKLLKSEGAEVHVAPPHGIDAVLNPNAYVCVLNDDQDVNPGGKITLKEPLVKGAALAVISDEAYVQPTVFTNRGAFFPTVLNDSLDRLTILCQQLVEQVGRAITTDPTDTVTPAELKRKLLDAANSATVVAKGYAEAAAASAADAKQSRDDILDHKQEIVDAVTAEGDKQNQRLVTEGDRQDQRLVSEGNTQIDRIKAEAGNTLIVNGTGCAEKFWALSADTPAGTDIVIPSGIKYLVDRHHLRVAWNGLVLAIGQNFTEVGAQDTFSTTFRLTFDAKAGDEIDVWIGALGKGDVAEALALAGEASAAVADLSRKVVYKEEV